MVERYNSSTSVQAAPVAKPDGQGLQQLTGAVRNLANTALSEATRKIEERNLALESAALNNAQLELAKRGGQLALDLQQGRIAGSDYVKDLEAARKTLKQDVWNTLPARVQTSTRAKMQFDELWTGDEIAATRSAVAWQADQEKKYAVQSLDNRLLALSAAAEVDPDNVKGHLQRWQESIPTLGGLLDSATQAKAQVDGAQALMQGAVRGLSKQGRFDEAKKLVTDAAAGLEPSQRQAFENFIKDAENEIEREKARQEAELAKTQRANGNQYEVKILQGGGSFKEIEDGVKAGKFSVNDQPSLMRALREEQDRRKREAEAVTKLTPSQMQKWKDQSASWQNTLLSTSVMPTDVFMGDRSRWAPRHQAMYDAMTPDDQRAVDLERQNLRDGRGTYATIDKIEGQMLDVAKRVVDDAWGLNESAAKRPPVADKLMAELRAQAADVAALNSTRDLTPEQLNQAVAVALKKAGEKNSDWMEWQLYAREMDPEGRRASAAPAQRASDMGRLAENTFNSEYQKAFNELKTRLGEDPDPADVVALMERRRAKAQ